MEEQTIVVTLVDPVHILLRSNNVSVRLCNFFGSFIHALGKAAKAEHTYLDRGGQGSRLEPGDQFQLLLSS